MSLTINEWQRVNLHRWAERGVDGFSVSQSLPLSIFSRLLADVPDADSLVADVSVVVDVRAFFAPASPGASRGPLWLSIKAETAVPLTCQRCLKPVAVPLLADQAIRFVATEAQAAEEDEDAEVDVLAFTPELDVLALIEDELIMSVPIVALHESCEPEGYKEGEAPVADRPNPFAVLAQLKKDR